MKNLHDIKDPEPSFFDLLTGTPIYTPSMPRLSAEGLAAIQERVRIERMLALPRARYYIVHPSILDIT